MPGNTSNWMTTHFAYEIRDTNDPTDQFRRIGDAWQHRDGHGFSIRLDAVPLNGWLAVRPEWVEP